MLIRTWRWYPSSLQKGAETVSRAAQHNLGKALSVAQTIFSDHFCVDSECLWVFPLCLSDVFALFFWPYTWCRLFCFSFGPPQLLFPGAQPFFSTSCSMNSPLEMHWNCEIAKIYTTLSSLLRVMGGMVEGLNGSPEGILFPLLCHFFLFPSISIPALILIYKCSSAVGKSWWWLKPQKPPNKPPYPARNSWQ